MTQIAYCSNVHPGRNLDQCLDQLQQHSLAVKQIVSPESSIGIGLWLSATTTEELDDPKKLDRMRGWLAESGLVPFTFNGFPFGDFHQPIVKHAVYRPTWAESSRLDYTIRLAEIQDQLLPAGIAGTISTLPLGWPTKLSAADQQTFYRSCADNLRRCATQLANIEQQSRRHIMVCLEPEPGCLIDTCHDLVAFFENHLLTGHSITDDLTRRHVGVCHDVCHSAVMFEEQRTAIKGYSEAGIQIGKIQISSAIAVDFDSLAKESKQPTLDQLAAFAEPRYLHQTSILSDEKTIYFEDLSLALQRFGTIDSANGQWRVHFHVPIFAECLGRVNTTRFEIRNCLAALKEFDCPTEHLEIETYAWNVLPAAHQTRSLANGISQEWKWLANLLADKPKV